MRQIETTMPGHALAPTKAPPTFPGTPVLGHYRALRNDWLALLLKAMEAKGDVVRIPVLHRSVYLLSGPSALDHVLVRNHRNYLRSENASVKAIRPIIGEGVLTTDGRAWARSRREVKASFQKTRLERMAPISLEYTRNLIERWQARADRDVPVELARDLMALTSQISFDMLFGYGMDFDEALRFVDHFLTTQNHLFGRMTNPLELPGRRVRRAIRGIRELAARVEARGNGEIPRDQILTFLASAPENPSNALAWSIFLLAGNPEEMHALRRSLASNSPAYAALVLKESLRLYPGAWGFDRIAVGEDTIGGFRIPKGALVLLAPYVMHRNPRYWQDPNAFIPQRFADGALPEESLRAYLPFGAGPRKCIGEHFGMLMVRQVFPLLVEAFDFRLAEGEVGATRPMFTLRPKTGVLAYISRAS